MWAAVTSPAPYVGATHLNDAGTVSDAEGNPVAPEALASGAGLELNRLALARAITSEEGRKYPAARLGIAHAIVNEARARGLSVAALVTRARKKVDGVSVPATGDGFFGKQGQGRYCSSAQDHDDDAAGLADDVLSGATVDPTGGARQFDSPAAFGRQEGTDESDADDVKARRLAAGNELVVLPGVPESHLRFWRPA